MAANFIYPIGQCEFGKKVSAWLNRTDENGWNIFLICVTGITNVLSTTEHTFDLKQTSLQEVRVELNYKLTMLNPLPVVFILLRRPMRVELC